jgi:hypothetical protein
MTFVCNSAVVVESTSLLYRGTDAFVSLCEGKFLAGYGFKLFYPYLEVLRKKVPEKVR